MKKVAALLLAALVVPGVASAKPGPSARSEAIQVCGPGGCETIRLDARGGLLVRWRSVQFAAPPRLAPYNELRSERLSPGGRLGFYVPSRDLLKVTFSTGQPQWMRATPRAARRLEARFAGEPWPAPTITEAFVAARRAQAADGYARLFDPAEAASPRDARAEQIMIVLRSERVTPWTDGYPALAYLPEEGLLRRGGQYVRAPEPLRGADRARCRPRAVRSRRRGRRRLDGRHARRRTCGRARRRGRSERRGPAPAPPLLAR